METKVISNDFSKKNIPQLIEIFSRTIKILISDLSKKFPNDAVVYNVNRKTTVAVDLVPERIIEAVGKNLVNYTDQIRKADYDFFLNADFKSELPAESVADEKEKLCIHVIKLVKENWGKLGNKEKRDYHQLVNNLLDCYVKYRILILENKKQKQ
jgi:hypothetical protein